MPKARFGAGRTWVARELQWDAYLLRAASVYEEACGHHTITQGGYYQYSGGANLGSRSWLHYLLPMVYDRPGNGAGDPPLLGLAAVAGRAARRPYGSVPLC